MSGSAAVAPLSGVTGFVIALNSELSAKELSSFWEDRDVSGKAALDDAELSIAVSDAVELLMSVVPIHDERLTITSSTAKLLRIT